MAVAVEDFPQMWERPSYATILEILQALELKPPIWNHRRRRSDILIEQESLASQRKGEVTRYLSSIIKSPLAWIEDDEQRENLWACASRRMAERCGRTAMGEVVRTWPFDGDEDACEPFELVIREPALTGDSLGFKTWGSSYVLAQQLIRLRGTSLSQLFEDISSWQGTRILELGSGTGLLGLAAAALWKASVALSDLPDIVTNLKVNKEKNEDIIRARGGSLQVGPLTWGGSGPDEVDEDLFGVNNQFKLVIVADPLYDDNHPQLLADAIAENLSFEPESRAVVMVPQRDETTKRLRDSFKKAMLGLETSLTCDEEEELEGQDDWTEDEDGGHVKCWLGIFSRGGKEKQPPV